MKIILTLIFLFQLGKLSASSADEIFKGKYTWGHEVNTFQVCNASNVYWISGSSWIRGPLKDFYIKSTTKPYQSIYIEFRGHILDEELGGFAERYDGLIRISEVKNKQVEMPENCETHKKALVSDATNALKK